MSAPDWHSRAACRGLPTEMFFPGKGREPHDARAKVFTICSECPVRQDCLEWAISDADLAAIDGGRRGGYWGGTSSTQRHEIRQRIISLLGGQR